jgi:hypothetical protein
MRPFFFSCFAAGAFYSVACFSSLGSFSTSGSAISSRAASAQSNYPVASPGEVFRHF